MSGYLIKLGKRRYFRLKKDHLLWFLSEDVRNEKFIYSLGSQIQRKSQSFRMHHRL